MRPRHLLVAVVVLLAGLFLWSPTSADAQIACSECTCSSSCSTTCTYPAPPPDPWEPECIQDHLGNCYGTCGTDGICTTTFGCKPKRSNQSCSNHLFGSSNGDTLCGPSSLDCIDGKDVADTLSSDTVDF